MVQIDREQLQQRLDEEVRRRRARARVVALIVSTAFFLVFTVQQWGYFHIHSDQDAGLLLVSEVGWLFVLLLQGLSTVAGLATSLSAARFSGQTLRHLRVGLFGVALLTISLDAAFLWIVSWTRSVSYEVWAYFAAWGITILMFYPMLIALELGWLDSFYRRRALAHQMSQRLLDDLGDQGIEKPKRPEPVHLGDDGELVPDDAPQQAQKRKRPL